MKLKHGVAYNAYDATFEIQLDETTEYFPAKGDTFETRWATFRVRTEDGRYELGIRVQVFASQRVTRQKTDKVPVKL